jgi:segregation and condensation protein A
MQMDDSLQIEVDGYAGPLDLLLELTREGKVDIRQVPVDQIASQFLNFVETRLATFPMEVVSEWLVVAAVLVQMKSRLLLPVRSKERKEADEAVEDLAERLHRLGVARDLAALMQNGLVLGRDWFRPGRQKEARSPKLGRVDFASLVRAFAADAIQPVSLPTPQVVKHVFDLVTVKDAVRHLREKLADGGMVDFLSIVKPFRRDDSPVRKRSAVTSAFVALMGATRTGQVDFEIDPETLRIVALREASSGRP